MANTTPSNEQGNSLKRILAFAVILAILFLVNGYILYRLYSTSRLLVEARKETFVEEFKGKAAVLDDDLSQRMKTLEALTNSPAIANYYHSKALGMSKEYGLAVFLRDLDAEFNRIQQISTEKGLQVFAGIGYLDFTENEMLAVSGSIKDFPGLLSKGEKWRNSAAGSVKLVTVPEVGSGDRLLIFGPVHYRGEVRGIVLMELSKGPIERILQLSSRASLRDFTALTDSNGRILVGPPSLRGTNIKNLFGISGSFPEYQVFDSLQNHEEPGARSIGALIRLPQSSLYVFTIASRLRYFAGHSALLWMGVVFCLMGSLALMGTLIYKGARIRHIMFRKLNEAYENLETRVQERTAELSEKNRELGSEIEQRNRAEAALRQSQLELRTSEARWRFALEGAGDGVWDWNAWTDEVYFSKQLKTMLGYEEHEVGNTLDEWARRIHPDDQDRCHEDLKKHFDGSTPFYETEHRILAKDGSYKWILNRGKALEWTDHGKPARVIGTSTDISLRKQMETALEESELRFRSLFEGHSAVMLLIDPGSGVLVDANLAAADYYGYPLDELLQKSIADIDCLQPDQVFEYCQRATGHEQSHVVSSHRLANGDVRTVEVYSSPIEIQGRTLLFSIVHDITDRQLQEQQLQKYREQLEDLVNERTEELRRSELHLSNLVEQAGDAIFVYDRDSDRVVDCNKKACDGLGYTRDELLRLPISAVEVNFDKEQIAKITGALRPGEAVTVNGLHRRKDGTTFPVEARIGLIAPLGFGSVLGIVRDVSDRVQALHEKEALQKQLLQSQKMEAIGTLAAGIAHDFNNILFAITGYGEMALDEVAKDSSAYRSMKLSLEAADRGADLVRHILTFSREADQQKGTILLGPIIKEALKFLQSSLPASIEVCSGIKAGLHPVHADPTQMHQVFMNLVTNAFHAMKEAGGVLTVNLDEVDVTEGMAANILGLAAGTYCKLSVSDTGHGMSRQVLERIFDPFFTTKEKGQGTGLGLSVVDGIVKNHGGVIKVESSQGVGTTFEVYLPIERTDAQICHAETVRPASPVSLKRILFVDDDRTVSGAAQGNLEQLGFEVVAENDPVRALALFAESPQSFDLIMTDIGMPKMTGLQLAERISEIRRDIPVIAITGYADLMNKTEALNSGIVDVIYKPIRRTILAQTLAKVLSKELC